MRKLERRMIFFRFSPAIGLVFFRRITLPLYVLRGEDRVSRSIEAVPLGAPLAAGPSAGPRPRQQCFSRREPVKHPPTSLIATPRRMLAAGGERLPIGTALNEQLLEKAYFTYRSCFRWGSFSFRWGSSSCPLALRFLPPTAASLPSMSCCARSRSRIGSSAGAARRASLLVERASWRRRKVGVPTRFARGRKGRRGKTARLRTRRPTRARGSRRGPPPPAPYRLRGRDRPSTSAREP